MDFNPTLTAMMGLDYNSSSIGIDFGSTAQGVKKIQVIPDGTFTVHRVTQKTLDLYTSSDNSTYKIVPRSNWSFATDSQGIITITLTERIATRYLKVHVKFDERDTSFTAKNKATFLNDMAKMLRVYQEATSRTEEFQYDAAGNRTYQRVTLIQAKSYTSSYYTNSDRLKTDGKYAFVYDEAGNMVKKGNTYSISSDIVTFTKTSGDGVEYWQYTYDLLNRLIEVTKNGTVVSNYKYSPDGLREVKRGSSGTIHYVFEGTEPIFEKRISSGKIKSYVYASGKHLARVDGVIGDSTAKVYYYHTDQVGSVKAVTDQSGKVVYNADYLPFGSQFTKDGDFDETHGFTGKELDSDTGLYYNNARWYDSEIGRFISEDPMGDPNNPNLYSYCANNPLTGIDPTGLYDDSGETNWDNGGYEGYTATDEDMAGAGTYDNSSEEYGSWSCSSLSDSSTLELDGKIDFGYNYMSKYDINYDQTVTFPDKAAMYESAALDAAQVHLQNAMISMGDKAAFEDEMNKYDYCMNQFNILCDMDSKIQGLENGILNYQNGLKEFNPLGSNLGKNPSRQEIIDYITQQCEKIGLSVQIGLATAWTESGMKQFYDNGKTSICENKDKNNNLTSTDWGMMQINDKAWNGVFDFNDIKSDWQYNVNAGLGIALMNYMAAEKAEESDLARATYSGYNAGTGNMDRYRTESDYRDINFWNNYQNSPWNK
jgi:RHS repeat-associated protein